ncbi:MAG: hypothetical protein ACN4EJ_05095, partial [Porticoccaceae bacterium]
MPTKLIIANVDGALLNALQLPSAEIQAQSEVVYSVVDTATGLPQSDLQLQRLGNDLIVSQQGVEQVVIEEFFSDSYTAYFAPDGLQAPQTFIVNTSSSLSEGAVWSAQLTEPAIASTTWIAGGALLAGGIALANNESSSSEPIPDAPTINLSDDTGVSASDGLTNNGRVSVDGLTEGLLWQYSTDAGVTWQEGSNGFFELAEGSYAIDSIQARQVNNSGIAGEPTSLGALVVDTTNPSTLSISLESDSGSSSDDQITNDGTINVAGVEDDATWQYRYTGLLNWANGSGSSFELPEGDYENVQIRQIDAAGNEGSFVDLGSTVIDATNPSTLSISLESDSGSSSDDQITNDGTINVSGVEDGATWQYRYD